MRYILRKTTTVLGVSIATAVLLFVGLFSIFHQKVDALDGLNRSGRLITIHDRGEEKVFLSEAGTIADALKDAGITVDSHDAVEPALSEKLVASEYQINIYRARPVTVIDGATRQKVVTAYQTSEQIVEDVGIKLHEEDTTSVSRSDDILNDGAGLQLVIDRAVPFELNLYGSKTTARTQGRTVEEMLKEKNVALTENDRVSVDLSTPITEGMKVRVWREGKQTVTVKESVPFKVEKIRDADREYGYSAIQTPGKNGKREVTYEVTVRDGKEVSRKEIASLTIVRAKKQIEVIGAKLPTPTNPSENQALGHIMMLNAGFDEDQWPCLYNLWMRESGWTTTAGNTLSGAYGIPQALPATKMASVGADYLTNPRTQIEWGLRYIKGRYGTPCGGWDHFLSHNWY